MVCDIVTENLIKGIIVAHSRTGITIKQIANEFEQYTGDYWPFLHQAELNANEYLHQIDGILSITNENNEKLWYVRGKTLTSESRGKIYRSNNLPIASSEFDKSKKSTWQQSHGSIPNTCNQYKRGGGGCGSSSNNFSNGRNNKYSSGGRNNNGYINHNTNNINGNYAPRNSMQQKFYKNNGIRMNGGHGFGLSHANSPGDSEPKTKAALHDFDLVGDDFFLELARIDLRSALSNRKRIQRCGLCISGQRISDATDRIRRNPQQQNMKMIVNLGSVDILLGSDLADICQNYMELMEVCERRSIQTIITTLAPLANRLHCPADTKKVQQFNEFLINKFSSKFPIIDIASCMVDRISGKILFGCYQAEAKYVTGSNQPHLLWNRIGRQRILKKMKSNLPI